MKNRLPKTLSLLTFMSLMGLPLLSAQDTDGDFLSDTEELARGSSPYDTDTDGDGLTDRAEVFPYQVVTGAFTFEEAMADAASKGGWLAIIDTPQKLYAVKRGIQSGVLGGALPTPLPNNYDPAINLPSTLWVGARDKLTPGHFQWVVPSTDSSAPYDGTEVGSAGFADLAPSSNIVNNVANIYSFTVGRPFVASGVPSGTTITAINAATRTLTLSNPVESEFAQRIAQITVSNAGYGYTASPVVSFSGGTLALSSVSVSSAGSGYTSAPAVTITGGGGSGATAVATIGGSGQVTAIILTSRGSGYTSAPTIGLTDGGGTGATAIASLGSSPTAVATLADGRVKSIAVVADNATYYTAAPAIVISGGNGTGAAASAVLTVSSTANVAAIAVNSAGIGYNLNSVTATLSGGSGVGAAASVTANALGQITGVAVTNPGIGYVSAPKVVLSSGLTSVRLDAGGTGYTSAPTVTLSAPTAGGTQATATATVTSGAVTGFSITNFGSGYTSAPTVTLTGGGGSGATASCMIGTGATATASIRQFSGRVQSPVPGAYVNWGGNYPLARSNSSEGVYLNTGTGFTWGTSQVSANVSSVTVTGGSGYTAPPNLTIVGGGGTGATAEATLKIDGTIAANIVNPGTGYTTAPSVIVNGGIGLAPSGIVSSISIYPYVSWGSYYSNVVPSVVISGGGGTGASAVAFFGTPVSGIYSIAGIYVTNGGSGDTSAPTVTFAAVNGSGASAVATITKSATPIVVTSAGSGYSSPPTVTISGGGGSGATAYATLNNGGVSTVTVVNPGTNYNINPTVTFSGGGGSGAAAVASIGVSATATAAISISESNTNRSYVLERAATSPAMADTDGDGLNDLNEFRVYHTDPLLADTDGDGINDNSEINQYNSNPLVWDTDSDGFNDGDEIATGTNPLLASSHPLPSPTITLQPVSVTEVQGNGVTFQVAAIGAPSYQWQKDGVNMPNEISASLVLRNVQTAQSGSYRAIVTNAAGSVTSSTATLTVVYSQAQYDANQVGASSGQVATLAVQNASGFYTLDQVQALNVGSPLLTRDAVSKKFKLTVKAKKSTDLKTYTDLPFSAGDAVINGNGEMEFQFFSPDNAAFFRLESR